MGASDEAARVGERALAIAEETGDIGLQMTAWTTCGINRARRDTAFAPT